MVDAREGLHSGLRRSLGSTPVVHQTVNDIAQLSPDELGLFAKATRFSDCGVHPTRVAKAGPAGRDRGRRQATGALSFSGNTRRTASASDRSRSMTKPADAASPRMAEFSGRTWQTTRRVPRPAK
jgi:hypothetical protein